MVTSAEPLERTRRTALVGALTPSSSLAVVDPVRDARWATLVRSAQGATIFHEPAWLALLERTYGYPVLACVVLDADGALEAGLPLALVGGRITPSRFVALPFSDAVPPLARDARPSQWRRLSLALHQVQHLHGRSIELRGDLPDGHLRRPVATYLQHVVDLGPGYDAVVRAMRPAVMRGVRRSQREGLVVERRTDRGALEEFFRLHVESRRRHGVPTQPRRFVMGLEDLLGQGLGHVVLVRDGRHAAAAAVMLSANRTLTYKYGASDRRFLAKRPNNLLFAETIRWACEQGMRQLDLGRSDESATGLTSFKRSFGAHERPLAYSLFDGSVPPSRGSAGHLAATVIRRSPAVVSRVAGELLYRDLGP